MAANDYCRYQMMIAIVVVEVVAEPRPRVVTQFHHPPLSVGKYLHLQTLCKGFYI